MLSRLRYVAIVVIAISAYVAGRYDATNKYERILLERENAAQAAIINAQKEAKNKYEKRLQEAVARAVANEQRYIDRMRQLERKIHSSENVGALRDERDRALRVAIGLENVAERAVGALEIRNNGK